MQTDENAPGGLSAQGYWDPYGQIGGPGAVSPAALAAGAFTGAAGGIAVAGGQVNPNPFSFAAAPASSVLEPIGTLPGSVLLPGSVGADILATNPGWLGDGSDGDVVITGNTTVYLTRDMYYHNLTITASPPNSNTIYTCGWAIFCTGTLTIEASAGGIQCAGGPGGAAAGATTPGTAGLNAIKASNGLNVPTTLSDMAGYGSAGWEPSSPGVAGVTNAVGTPGYSPIIGLGVNGVAGQTASGHAGGAGGVIALPTSPRDLTSARIHAAGSAGSGSSGARNATSSSGGSGGAGGRILISARSFIVPGGADGLIFAYGGAGGAGWTGGAATSAVNSEASPAGPGGVVVLIYKNDPIAALADLAKGGNHPWGGRAPSGITIQLQAL